MVGLSTGNTDANYNTINFAVYITQGSLLIYESGNYVGSFGTFDLTYWLQVRVNKGRSNFVEYFKNGVLIYTSGRSKLECFGSSTILWI